MSHNFQELLQRPKHIKLYTLVYNDDYTRQASNSQLDADTPTDILLPDV